MYPCSGCTPLLCSFDWSVGWFHGFVDGWVHFGVEFVARFGYFRVGLVDWWVRLHPVAFGVVCCCIV